jgi:hypothetical protein
MWFTAEARRARSKEFLIKKYSELCELCVSVVKTSSQQTRNHRINQDAFSIACAMPPK